MAASLLNLLHRHGLARIRLEHACARRYPARLFFHKDLVAEARSLHALIELPSA